MFKKTLCALSLISVSYAAFSAPVANLKVTGSITPPTCTIDNQNEVDVNINLIQRQVCSLYQVT